MFDKVKNIIHKSGKLGPLFGGILGVVPQCGFSASAAGLYAGRVISSCVFSLRIVPVRKLSKKYALQKMLFIFSENNDVHEYLVIHLSILSL